MEQTAITWCDSTFNPWIGCTEVSKAEHGGGGCDHCYARVLMQDRYHRVQWGPGQPRVRTKTWGDPVRWNKRPFFECAECSTSCTWRGECNGESCPVCNGHVVPARQRVFCASLADVFDNEVDPAWRDELMGLIVSTPNLDWLLLTKRIGNVEKMLKASAWEHLPHVWLGATVVNQAEADRDVPKLLATPARVRFLSIEPMLGPITIRVYLDLRERFGLRQDAPPLDWIIAGGESGPKARPSHLNWFRSLRDQCAAAGVPFHFKQWGEWTMRGPESMGYPLIDDVPRRRITNAGQNGQDLGASGGDDVWMQRSGTKRAGRLLDGVEHNGFPEA